MPNYIAGNGITIENNIISSKTTSTSEIGSFKVDGSTIYIDNNNVIHGKKEQKITLSDTTLEINAETTTVTVTEHIGDGTLSVSSSDTDVVTASISDNTITVTGVDSGEATIIVTASATSAYQEATATIAVTATVIKIYGAEWDGSSSPVWTRTDAAASFTDPNPYYAGMSGTPSSPFDNIMPWSGMRIVEDKFGAGTLVEIPKFYYKWTKNGSSMKLQISMTQENGFLCSPAHADRGDGVGERDYVYIGRYKSNLTNYKSDSGKNPGTAYRYSFRQNIHKLGTNIWQNDFAMFWTIRMLYLVEFAHWDSQLKIGYGDGNTSWKAVGYTDKMPYHTGTTYTSRTAYACGTQYRYIEGLWDTNLEWVDGIYVYYYSLYCINNPANFNDWNGGTSIGSLPSSSSNGSIASWNIPSSVTGYEYALYPGSATGSSDIYSCDTFYSYGTTDYCCLATGAPINSQSLVYGMFYMNFGKTYNANNDCCSRLMVLPPSRLTSTT